VSDLRTLIAEEITRPVDQRVSDFAASIAAEYGEASRAVLFYGSCLRTTELEGQMLDFYLIVSSYEEAYGKSWLVRANKLLPPNVFPAEYDGLVAKVAVLSEEGFVRLCSTKAGDVSVWARFAQPSRLIWTAGDEASIKAESAITDASKTLFYYSAPMTDSADPLEIWRTGFALTYQSELRAERKGRSNSVIENDLDRYRRFGEALLAEQFMPSANAEKNWRTFRRRGKLLTLARLAKASGTYAGGIDYLAWKINRHAGTDYQIKPWQRKWPILGAITMLPRLIAGGAIK